MSKGVKYVGNLATVVLKVQEKLTWATTSAGLRNKRQQRLLDAILNNNWVFFKYSFNCDYFALDSQSDIEKCFDFLLDYFVSNGLKRNDEPSDFGIEIENINKIMY